MMHTCSCSGWKHGHRVGLFFVGMLILCFAWYGINYAGRALHLQFLQASFLWFQGMDATSVVLAVIQAYIYGYIVVGVWKLSGWCNTKTQNGREGSCCSGEKK